MVLPTVYTLLDSLHLALPCSHPKKKQREVLTPVRFRSHPTYANINTMINTHRVNKGSVETKYIS
jgi:hypothetical protein